MEISRPRYSLPAFPPPRGLGAELRESRSAARGGTQRGQGCQGRAACPRRPCHRSPGGRTAGGEVGVPRRCCRGNAGGGGPCDILQPPALAQGPSQGGEAGGPFCKIFLGGCVCVCAGLFPARSWGAGVPPARCWGGKSLESLLQGAGGSQASLLQRAERGGGGFLPQGAGGAWGSPPARNGGGSLRQARGRGRWSISPARSGPPPAGGMPGEPVIPPGGEGIPSSDPTRGRGGPLPFPPPSPPPSTHCRKSRSMSRSCRRENSRNSPAGLKTRRPPPPPGEPSPPPNRPTGLPGPGPGSGARPRRPTSSSAAAAMVPGWPPRPAPLRLTAGAAPPPRLPGLPPPRRPPGWGWLSAAAPSTGGEGGREGGEGAFAAPPRVHLQAPALLFQLHPTRLPPPPPQMMASLAGQRSTHAGTRGHALPPNKPRPAHGWKKPTATVQGEKNNPGSPGHNQSPAALPVPKLRHRASAWVPGSLQAAFRPFDPTKKKKKKEN